MITKFLRKKLLPCPFCGAPASMRTGIDDDGDEWISLGCSRLKYDALTGDVPCVASTATRHPAYDEAVLIDAWNNRAPAANHKKVDAALDAARSAVWSWQDYGNPTKTQLKRLQKALSKIVDRPRE